MLFRKKRIRRYKRYVSLLTGKCGLEIGGPSGIFSRRGLIPIYSVLKSLDGCNFDTRTVWEGRIQEGPGNYRFDERKPAGHQYIREATDLRSIESGTYDAVLSSHCIEHCANPLKAVSEWLRVLKTGGLLLLVVPHKDGTFDHRRPVTSWEHLLEDFEREVAEDDLNHLSEILEFHDLTMDTPAGNIEAFRCRSMNNRENRCLHQHVFDTRLAIRLIDHFRIQILDVQAVLPHHIVILSRKTPVAPSPDNSSFLSRAGRCFSESPFPTDAVSERRTYP